MILNILFFTITIKKRKVSEKEYNHYQLIKQIEEENRNRLSNLPRMF